MWLAIALSKVLLVAATDELLPGKTWSQSTTARCAWIDTNQDDSPRSTGFGADWLVGFLPGARSLLRSSCASTTSKPVSHKCVSAEFSAPMPTDPLCLLVIPAEPLDACTPLDYQTMIASQSNIDAVSPGTALSKKTVAVAAARGNCSFATKAHSVAKFGAAMLIVIDTAPDAKAMPMANDPSTSEASSKLLSVMVGADADSEALMAALATKTVYYATSYTPDDDNRSVGASLMQEELTPLSAAILFVCLVIMSRWALSPADTQDNGKCVWPAALMLALFLAAVSWVRLQASMRTLTIAPGVTAAGVAAGTKSVYDHRETDEVVLRFLVDSIKEHGLFAGYSLTASPEGAALRRQLRLAPDNYDFPLFHHPPGFVLLAYIAEHFCGLPSPALPIMLAAISSLLSVRLATQYLGLGLEGQLWAAVIHALCPLTWFTSQKFWLDNALTVASTAALTIAAAALVYPQFSTHSISVSSGDSSSSKSITRSSTSADNFSTSKAQKNTSIKTRSHNSARKELLGKNGAIPSTSDQSFSITSDDSTTNMHGLSIHWALMPAAKSAIVFALALWCKLTAALAAPALVIVAFGAPSMQHPLLEPPTKTGVTNSRAMTNANLRCLDYKHVSVVATRLCVAVLIVTLFYAPWLLWYHRATGLWLPPAIPSPAMLQHSAFVAAALGRGAVYYPAALLRLNPAYWFAVVLPGASSNTSTAAFKAPEGIQTAAAVSDGRLGSNGVSLGTCVLWVWVISWVGGMTAVGVLGSAGFQMRFILPATPALAALAAQGVVQSRCLAPLAAIFLAIAAAHCLLFGLLFAPLAADIGMPHQSLWGAVMVARETPLPYPPPATLQDAWKLLEHYGIVTG